MSDSVDPYDDPLLIDERATRVNQAFVALFALLGIIWPVLWLVMALQLLIGVIFGRRYCLPCVLYFELLRRWVEAGPLKDIRPVRFANKIGIIFLLAAFAVSFFSWQLAGVLASMVAVLAAAAAVFNFCLGCYLYKLKLRLTVQRVDHLPHPPEPGSYHLMFTHPLCSKCQEWKHKLMQESLPLREVLVNQHVDMTNHYGVQVVPTIYRVEDGQWVEQIV